MMALCFLLIPALSLHGQQQGSNRLSGVVRDSEGKPLPAATLQLQQPDQPPRSTTSDSSGRYVFTALREGKYVLHIHAAGCLDADLAVVINPGDSKVFDVKLASDPNAPAFSQANSAPSFYDPPQFTVSGVTDTSNLGGHGSDTITHVRNSLSKEAVSLGSDSTPSAITVSPDTEKLLLEGVQKNPQDAAMHHQLAEIEEKLGKPLQAVQEYERAATLDPSEPYLFDWGSELLLHHAPEPAEKVFSKGHALFPRSTRMLIGLGAASFSEGAEDAAMQSIGQAADLDRANPVPYSFFGEMLASETKPPDTIIDRLKQFAELHPERADANYFYALALWKRHRESSDRIQIESLLRKSVQIDPKYALSYVQLGILDAEKGNFRGAVSNYKAALKWSPDLQEAHYRLAQAYRRLGEIDKAREETQAYELLSRKSTEEADAERHQIRQFVYTLRDQPEKPPR